MKFLKKLSALLLAVALITAAAGCSPRRGGESSEHSAPGANAEVSSVSVDTGTSDNTSYTPPSPPESDEPETGGAEESSEEAAAAMGADYAALAELDAEAKGWGPGGPTDDKGRPDGATVYQGKYGEYDAYFIAPESDKVYLTFDEGYEYGFTPAILDTLKEKDAKAVFFITMHFAKSQPDLVKRMVDEGHVLGNHSTAHKSFPTMPLSEAEADIMQLHDYVKSNFGYEMSLFRFPEGAFSEQTLALLQSLGYKSVFWSFAYRDWEVDNQPLSIDALDKITSKAHPGAIYLLHAVSRTNSEVLGEAIDLLREQGYRVAKWDIY